jgi:hypothetical protein
MALQTVNLSCSSCSLLALMSVHEDHKARGECQERTICLPQQHQHYACDWSRSCPCLYSLLVFEIKLQYFSSCMFLNVPMFRYNLLQNHEHCCCFCYSYYPYSSYGYYSYSSSSSCHSSSCDYSYSSSSCYYSYSCFF